MPSLSIVCPCLNYVMTCLSMHMLFVYHECCLLCISYYISNIFTYALITMIVYIMHFVKSLHSMTCPIKRITMTCPLE